MAATLQGNVNLGGTPVNLVVRFFTPNTDTEVMKACAPTDANGDFTIYGITPGTYDVAVKADNSLANLMEDEVFTDGNTTEINFGQLRRGDVTGDDNSSILDISAVGAWVGTQGACWGYAGDWLLPQCPSPPPPGGGACYGYVIS